MHLFLEGPVQTGKSTLIRECIAPYIDQIGGFSSQRLWQDEKPCGYRLAQASELSLDAVYHPGLSDVFTYHNGDAFKKDPSVFIKRGVEFLEQAGDKPLILLDEIGGSELLVPEFRNKLYEVLSGATCCIGVLKLADKAAFMSRAAGYPGEVVDYNRQLRKDLSDKFGAKILSFRIEEKNALKQEIEKFLEGIFL